MKIGLKFCAGCRPQKKNIAVYEELIRYLMNKGASLVNDYECCDYLFCISGCGCRCTSSSGCSGAKKIHMIDRSIDRGTFDRIKEEIEDAKKDGFN